MQLTHQENDKQGKQEPISPKDELLFITAQHYGNEKRNSTTIVTRIPGTNPWWKKRPSIVNPLDMLYIVKLNIIDFVKDIMFFDE